MKSRVTGSYLIPSTGRPSDRIPAYGSGRVCEAPGCGTVLSNYNPAPYCSLHVALGKPRPRA